MFGRVGAFVDSCPMWKLVLLGAILRALLLLYSAFHDSYFRVKYSDIDYSVITDGASAMWHGGSPFERATYRYTPLLGFLMLPNVFLWHHFGKLIFCACDLGAAVHVHHVLRYLKVSESTAKRLVCLCILFNPIVVNVSTRGNSDMVVTFLSLQVLSHFFRAEYGRAAAWLGLAVHVKLYPIIYVPALVFALFEATPTFSAFVAKTTWCSLIAVAACLGPTMLCWRLYGGEYLQESWFYHLGRVDHRHNLSPYFYMMYLGMAQPPQSDSTTSRGTLVAFLSQFMVLIIVALRFRKQIAVVFCLETMIFVAFNKVCTVQYFVWFIPFLPFLCKVITFHPNHTLSTKRTAFVLTLMWGGALALWMLVAMQLEFYGKDVYVPLWACSCGFFFAQVLVIAWLCHLARVNSSNRIASSKEQ